MKQAITNLSRAFVAVLLFVTFGPVNAQQELFTGTEAMIPMRDGVRLNTRVYVPTSTAEKFPILLLRTPYGIGNLSSAQLAAALPELAADGYRRPARHSRTIQVGRSVCHAKTAARSEGQKRD